MTFVPLKNCPPFAQLVPKSEKTCPGRMLAKDLAGTELSEANAKAWRRDLQLARRHLKAPAAKGG